jgi:hypothetical protein
MSEEPAAKPLCKNGDDKPVHSKGMCQACYRREGRRERGLQKPGPKPDPSKPFSRYGGEQSHHKTLGGTDRLVLEVGGHCGHGHLLTDASTYRYPDDAKVTPGKLVCKLCRIKSSRKAQGYSGNLDDPIQPWRGEVDKTHCANGHEYTLATTYLDPTTGYRMCKLCKKDAAFTFRAKRYGLSPEELQQMIEESRDLCAICGKQDYSLHVDHDHDTGAVRELLCAGCNKGLGHFEDTPGFLRAAADYLERHRALPILPAPLLGSPRVQTSPKSGREQMEEE